MMNSLRELQVSQVQLWLVDIFGGYLVLSGYRAPTRPSLEYFLID